jgi:hypothetical protein
MESYSEVPLNRVYRVDYKGRKGKTSSIHGRPWVLRLPLNINNY